MTRPRQMLLAAMVTAALQLAMWHASERGLLTQRGALFVILLLACGLVVALTWLASTHHAHLVAALETRPSQHQAMLDQVEQLESLNEMLVTLGRTKDPGLAFQGLARRIGRLVNCDRLGLAVLKPGGQEVQTYLSRVHEPERRRRPRPELTSGVDHSLFGQIMRTCETAVVEDLSAEAGEYADVQHFVSQGFRSAIVLPLMSRNRAIGTLTALSRTPAAFTAAHRDAMQPMAEVLAFAFVTQQQHAALEHFRDMETLAEVSLSVATDINGALQAIIGRCGVLTTLRPETAEDVDVIVSQADRIMQLLDRVRTAALERLEANTAHQTEGIPASPEEFGEA